MRRDFTIGLLLASAAQSMRAQEPAKQRRSAIVISTPPASMTRECASGRRFSRSCLG
jgi:hypothetical protein